jgi:putative membrane protein
MFPLLRALVASHLQRNPRRITNAQKRQSVWRGLVSGLAGGAVASLAMGQFHSLITKKWVKPPAEQQNEEDSTVKAASAVSESVFKHRLQPEEKKPASHAVHYAFGTTVGGLYGIAAERKPAVATAAGAPFGAAVWLGAHAVPALKPGKPPTREPRPPQAVEFASHVVYGVTGDAVRRLVRRML